MWGPPQMKGPELGKGRGPGAGTDEWLPASLGVVTRCYLVWGSAAGLCFSGQSLGSAPGYRCSVTGQRCPSCFWALLAQPLLGSSFLPADGR